jgi:flagellar assembly factor FliW
MKLTTPRFGVLSFLEEQMVVFPAGVLTAPESGHFVIIDDPGSAPFQWLVCVERPKCAITVLDPALVLNDADGPVAQSGKTTTFVVATPGSGSVAWWLDLRHPILINPAERTGEQVTLDDSSLPERFPVALQQPHETAE